MIHAPIHGSQVNKPAEVFKRYIANEEVVRQNTDADGEIIIDGETVIRIQNFYYHKVGTIRWADDTARNDGDYQPINGLVLEQGDMSIKYMGAYRPSKNEPSHGDIIVLNGERWVVGDNVNRARLTSLRNRAIVRLSLTKKF
jgi:hypothetical protein